MDVALPNWKVRVQLRLITHHLGLVAPPQSCLACHPQCRSVECFERIDRIAEGTYGVVYKAREYETGEIVALKRIKILQ